MLDFDKKLYWTGIIYFVGLFLLGVTWWQALMVAVAMSLSWFLTYSRRTVGGLGTITFVLGLATWFHFIPDPSHWNMLLTMARGASPQ